MKKEILELVVLGLQNKGLLSIENIVTALTILPEKQQFHWIETMFQNKNELEFEENENSNDSTTHVLKVTPMENASKLEIVVYVKRLLDCSLKEAKDLVYDNKTFELKLSEPRAASTYAELKNLHCNVTMHHCTQDSHTLWQHHQQD